jgi:two-component system, response regulator PdtaR
MKRLRILIVEDEAVIALLLGETLESMGHEVCAIEGTQAGAIAAARRCRPDLLIVDERLGDGSGLAVVDEVLRDRPVPYIFASGDVFRVQRVMPHAVVMEKPYHAVELARAIGKAMASVGATSDFAAPRPFDDETQSRPPV